MRLRNQASKADGMLGWPAIHVEAARVQALLGGPYAGALESVRAHSRRRGVGRRPAARCLLDGAEAAASVTRRQLRGLRRQQSAARRQGGTTREAAR